MWSQINPYISNVNYQFYLCHKREGNFFLLKTHNRTTQKTKKDEQHGLHQKIRGERRCSRRVSRSHKIRCVTHMYSQVR